MRRTLLFMLFIAINGLALSQDYNKYIVDSLVRVYIENGKYDSASLVMVVFANQEHKEGNLKTALEYQLRNVELVEQNIDIFASYGLTIQDLLNDYGMISVLQRDLGETTKAIETYLTLARIAKLYLPQELPFYTNLMASTLGGCTTSPYSDSIYCLQDDLNIIKRQFITRENVKKYIWFCRCFNMNRMFNSFDNKMLVDNKLDEIIDWHDKNNTYILGLDKDLYGKEILEYELDFADLLYLFAGAISAQFNRSEEAIAIYDKEVSILSSLLQLDSSLNQKIASCYAKVSSEYFQLGDIVKCKEYSDKTVEYLYNHENNFDYCDILSTLALNYANVGHHSLAYETKLKEIETREKLGWHCSQTDWGLLFMYAKKENPEFVLKYKEEALSKSASEGGEFGVFQNIGDAYSLLMNEKKEYKDSAESYFHKAIEEFESHEEFWRKYDLIQTSLSNIYKSWSEHYIRLKDYNKAYEYALKAVQLDNRNIYHVSVLAAMLHDTTSVHKFLPLYYNDLEDELSKMVSTLGSVESNIYLKNGESTPYHIPEWASWNPTDSVSVCFAYDAALLTNGMSLRYNTFAPYIENNLIDASEKLKLDRMRDNIYAITDVDQMVLALYKYEQAERELRKKINERLTNVHWYDIKSYLGKGEACVEFVKYTANAYPWSEEKTKTHYAALVLSDEKKSPVFVDLFDEDVLYAVYNLQPKSYDTEVGTTLFYELWGKLHNYIAGKSRVSFSPKGLLNLINIESLADSNGLIALNKYNLKRVSSTKEIINPSKKASIKSVVSYGGIDYAEMAEVITDSLNTRGNWNYLKNTLSEVNSIETSLNHNNIFVTTVTGNNATETSFKSLDGTNANVIHVASHGFYIPVSMRGSIPYYSKSDYTKNIQDELFYSGLIMSGGQYSWEESRFEAEKNDGILTSYEISKLDLHNVCLVVLSACETGIGDELYDGIYGLQRAFKKTGARSILMSLWQIDDKATSEYMGLFYEKLANGTSMHDAYTSTVNAMKEKYKDPNYWASFILLD